METLKRLASVKRDLALILFAVLSLCSAMAAASSIDSVSQAPLLLGGGGVPGNLVLTPSVEYPTVTSMANLGEYNNGKDYPGYFDQNKCYDYNSSNNGYFEPQNTNFANSRNCYEKWSGNFLNWAATQTIDPFRKALTGGYRVVDNTSLTILQKATRANKGSTTRSTSFTGTRTHFLPKTVNSSDSSDTTITKITLTVDSLVFDYSYKKSNNNTKTGSVSFKVRVQVCKTGLLEANCVKYGNNYKPEGLLQKYSNDIRYSVFSYLNIDGNGINGGVLRAQQDYIGEYRRVVGTPGRVANTKAEWDMTTGIIKKNPQPEVAVDGNSGVINYLNKFGELSGQLKSNDPVSELYYAAIRYLRNKGNLPSYSNQANSNQKKDYFPVITSWQDPIQYSCQKNAILGIGDANTHEDRDLLPSDDRFFNLVDYTQKIYDNEEISSSANTNTSFTGRGNSAYIAGLAYYANTNDMRPDMAGKQTAQTYWVDVRENQILENRKRNQYWLAAKYGGFEVPNNYVYGQNPAESTWYSTNDILETGDKRPDNFFVASDAQNMVDSLERAFAKIASDTKSSLTTVATNSSRLDTDTTIFQSRIDSSYWSGDLLAKTVNETGEADEEPAWSAAAKLNSLSNLDSRKILTVKPPLSGPSAELIADIGTTFTWNGLTSDQRLLLRASGESSDTNAKNRLKYLRGDRTLEGPGLFRERNSRLGDIVNSDPQYVFQQNYGYNKLKWPNQVGDKYTAFRASNAYKNRVPMVLVGANDGMLHAFNASQSSSAGGGNEIFAYVPNSIMDGLVDLTDPDYVHRYYVDGIVRIADAWFNNSWNTTVVGTTGAGGKSVFALNITNIKSSSDVTASNVMWEFTHPELGYTISQPSIVALPNNKFGVIVSSGYHNEAKNKGYIWILDIADGSIIKEFEISGSQGLGTPLAVDLTASFEADRVYVGDTNGKLWRIDLESNNPTAWKIPSSLNSGPLFIAKNSNGNIQPITAPLSSALNNKGEPLIVFGTGSFFREGDNDLPSNPNVETIYGIFDRGTLINNRTNLLKQEVIQEGNVQGTSVRAISNNTLESSHKGWYLDLVWTTNKGGTGAKGERVVAKASLLSGRAIFTSMTPANDPCSMGGTSMIMAIDLFTGGRLMNDYFDINKDGIINEDDSWTSDSDETIPWSGVSDPDDGVVKGAVTLQKWICYAGSNSSSLRCVPVAGSQREGRQSWQEVKINNE